MVKGKSVVMGVTGGIAAYKAAEIISGLKKNGIDVQVIMTRSAQKFITPLTLQTLSRNPVVVDMFAEPKSWEVQHIALADRADAFLIAPATANIIGKLANGIADDMLSTTVMATQAPVLLAPAMNVHMYANPVVQANCQRLADLGYRMIEPGVGPLACGYEGKGRLAAVEKIIQEVMATLQEEQDLAGLTILVTAGPTCEAIDPVRFITNRSTGKMGYRIAEMAQRRGAKVILVSGPTKLAAPRGVDLIAVESAQQMYQAVMDRYAEADVVIKAAAVADYRPKTISPEKIKKADGDLLIELERNPDILRELGQQKGSKILIGFAAETNNLQTYAAKKIRDKNLDFIVANDVTQAGAGFGVDTNIVKLLFADGTSQDLPEMNKLEVAWHILEQVKLIWRGRSKE